MRSSPNAIEDLLAEHGPGLTSDLAEVLCASGLSPATARKRLSRRTNEVRSLHGLPFPKKARFLYLDYQFGTDEYWDALIKAVEASSPAYAAALAGLRARGGIVPIAQFGIASGAPERQKKQLSSATILERLESVCLVARDSIAPIGECVCLGSNGQMGPVNHAALRARLLTETVLLDAIKAWAGKMNFASANATKVRGDTLIPRYATFDFDIVGPSYLRPLRQQRKNKVSPGFFVADVIAGKTLDEAHVAPFLRKCKTLGSLRKLRPFVPMVIADGFSREALHACRSAGIVATTPSTLFGQDVARALKDLFDTLSNAATVAATDPGRIETLFSSLSKVEGAVLNLRGALFELIVGHMVRAVEGPSIDLGVQVRDPNTNRRTEIDIRWVKEKRICLYECRGYQPASIISEAMIRTWLEEKVPMIYASLRQEERFSDSKIAFEFWTTGRFHPDALKLLRTAKKTIRKYRIGWKDSKAVRDYAQQIKAPGIRKILGEHYFNHPLTELSKSHRRRPVISSRKA